MTQNAYITDLSSFLPNAPVTNDQIEVVLGKIKDIPSLTKERMLANNKIEKRYYAIDPSTGNFTHTNAQLTAEAVKRLMPHDGFSLDEIQALCCGTTSPDLIMPGANKTRMALFSGGGRQLPVLMRQNKICWL